MTSDQSVARQCMHAWRERADRTIVVSGTWIALRLGGLQKPRSPKILS